MFVLGIDGGGTKVEFLVKNMDGTEVVRFTYAENCNLKYSSAQKIIAILARGLAQIENSIALSKISFAYCGIAECGVHSVGKNREDIVQFLQSHFGNRYELADDQYSVFRSASPAISGVLANAGTGSNISYYDGKNEYNHKSVGYAGRDFGKILMIEMYYGMVRPSSEIYKAVTNFLQQDPQQYYDALPADELTTHAIFTQIPKELSLKSEQNLRLKEELHVYLIAIAGRWAHKLTSYCRHTFNIERNQSFDLVLTGSVWFWERVRDITFQETTKVYPHINIIWNPDLHPVEGCVIIAFERCA